jgi:hypothetical protein
VYLNSCVAGFVQLLFDASEDSILHREILKQKIDLLT